MSGHKLIGRTGDGASRAPTDKPGQAAVRISAAFDVDVGAWADRTVGGRTADIPLQGGIGGAVVIQVVVADSARPRRAVEPEFSVFMDIEVRMWRGDWHEQHGVPELWTSRR
jgi:hypothetical protein